MKKEDNITCLFVAPGKFPKKITIPNTLKSLQEQVNGSIEAAYPFSDEIAIITNEEGKIDGLPLNRAIKDEDENIYDIFAGNFLIVGLTEDDFGSLSEELLEKYEKKFYSPEEFIMINNQVFVFSTEEYEAEEVERE